MIRGRVWRARGRYGRGTTWHYAVMVDGVEVFADNTANWRVVYDECREHIALAEGVLRSGQRLRPWAELIASAEDDL